MAQQALAGVWRLISYESHGQDGVTRFPYGNGVSGYLIYSAEGYMSVAIVGADRGHFASGDRLSGAPEEYAQAMRSYVSYCGRYEILPDRVIHHVELSQFPNWSGTDQVRFYEIEGDLLRLRTPPFALGGIEQTAHLVWERVTG